MAAPTDPDDVAWYKLGPGHGRARQRRVRRPHQLGGRLHGCSATCTELERGDVILVIDGRVMATSTLVESTHWVRAEGAPIEEIFAGRLIR